MQSSSRGLDASRLIPPPTVSVLSPSGLHGAHRVLPAKDGLSALQRSQRALEKHLQDLLDSQSQGLSAQVSQAPTLGVANGHGHDISLKDTRRSVTHTIQELAVIKADELDKLREQSEEVRDILAKSSTWVKQREALQHDINNLDQINLSKEIESLTVEDGHLEQQIFALNERLMQLRHRQQAVRARISKLKNSKASEQSSYETALAAVEKEVSSFLRMPLPEVLLHSDNFSLLSTLPPKRRTLDMLVDQAKQAQESLLQHENDVTRDHDALTNGSRLWQEAVRVIESFENHLRLAVRNPAGNASPFAELSVAPEHRVDHAGMEGPQQMLSQMHGVQQTLQGFFNEAQDHGWRLLIAAIGAELEAFKQGHDILQKLTTAADTSQDEPRRTTRASEDVIDDPANLLLSQPQDADEEGH
ncbi:MAG: hypothetical protein Q9159_001585 [Coniocarpon cinnabarinum]